MKVKPRGMLWMVPAGWLDDPAGATWPALEVLSDGRLMDGTNDFTLLDDAVRIYTRAVAP